MKAIILNTNEWGGNCTDEHIENNESLFSECSFTDVLPDKTIIKKIWNGSQWIEGATPEEILENDKPIVPEEISRMKFEMQVLITTGYEFEDIVNFIMGLTMSAFYKKLLLIRFKGCVTLRRDSPDLNTVSEMMEITQEELDEIFINGNMIE